jgi:glucosyl-3-phosphoglycerate phosphatase
VVWRHGRTAWNAANRFQGQLDPPLDDVGVAQARAAAQVLGAVDPVLVVTSDARRARATADVLGARCGVDVVGDARLREIHLGAWQGLTRDEVAERFPEQYRAWLAGDDARWGDGETYAEVGVRAVAAIGDVLREVPPARSVVVVVHGGTARASLGTLLALAPPTWWRLAPLGNCHWSTLLETPRGWRLVEHNVAAPVLPASSATGSTGPPL